MPIIKYTFVVMQNNDISTQRLTLMNMVALICGVIILLITVLMHVVQCKLHL